MRYIETYPTPGDLVVPSIYSEPQQFRVLAREDENGLILCQSTVQPLVFAFYPYELDRRTSLVKWTR